MLINHFSSQVFVDEFTLYVEWIAVFVDRFYKFTVFVEGIIVFVDWFTWYVVEFNMFVDWFTGCL